MHFNMWYHQHAKQLPRRVQACERWVHSKLFSILPSHITSPRCPNTFCNGAKPCLDHLRISQRWHLKSVHKLSCGYHPHVPCAASWSWCAYATTKKDLSDAHPFHRTTFFMPQPYHFQPKTNLSQTTHRKTPHRCHQLL